MGFQDVANQAGTLVVESPEDIRIKLALSITLSIFLNDNINMLEGISFESYLIFFPCRRP